MSESLKQPTNQNAFSNRKRTNPSPLNPLSKTRKMLCMRSWRRGIREMDLLLGGFADACLAQMTQEQLSVYATLLERDDLSLYALISQTQPIPQTDPHHDLLADIRQFHKDNLAQKI